MPTGPFADDHQPSGTGVLITQRIPFGEGAIEPHYDKCLDYQMPDVVEHYRALVTTVARLAGAHKGGHLPDGVSEQFPFEFEKLTVGERVPYTPAQLQGRVVRLDEFAVKYPALLPENIRSSEFLSRLREEVARFEQ